MAIRRPSIPVAPKMDPATALSLKQVEREFDHWFDNVYLDATLTSPTLTGATITAPAVSAPTVTDGVRHTGVTFANRPTGVAAGTTIHITDSNTVTWGATIAGGGTAAVLAFYNGTNWTVAGK